MFDLYAKTHQSGEKRAKRPDEENNIHSFFGIFFLHTAEHSENRETVFVMEKILQRAIKCPYFGFFFWLNQFVAWQEKKELKIWRQKYIQCFRKRNRKSEIPTSGRNWFFSETWNLQRSNKGRRFLYYISNLNFEHFTNTCLIFHAETAYKYPTQQYKLNFNVKVNLFIELVLNLHTLVERPSRVLIFFFGCLRSLPFCFCSLKLTQS